MDSVGLDSIPADVIFHLCTFLSDEDITSLSRTCLRLENVLDYDRLWRKYVTDGVKRLESRRQWVKPLCQPTPTVCENQQHVTRKCHLITNWRNGTLLKYSADTFYNLMGKNQVLFYKESYMLIRVGRDVQFWDISEKPVFVAVIPLNKSCPNFNIYIVENNLVVVDGSCSVDVYVINVQCKNISLVFSFLVFANEVRNEPVPHVRSHCCWGWTHYNVENYLVFSKMQRDDTSRSAIHLWDIANASKVGVFVLPRTGYHATVHSFENNVLFLKISSELMESYLKFNIVTKQFCSEIFETDIFLCKLLFYEDVCVMFTSDLEDVEGRGLLNCETFCFKTSNRLNQRFFPNAGFTDQRKVVDGKLIIFDSDGIHLVNVLNLETLLTIPNQQNMRTVLSQVLVFGLIFLVTLEGNIVNIWDLEKQRTTLNPPLEVEFRRRHVKLSSVVFVNELSTKIVLIDDKNMFVMHFW